MFHRDTSCYTLRIKSVSKFQNFKISPKKSQTLHKTFKNQKLVFAKLKARKLKLGLNGLICSVLFPPAIMANFAEIRPMTGFLSSFTGEIWPVWKIFGPFWCIFGQIQTVHIQPFLKELWPIWWKTTVSAV
jgi:hypothetical protein